MNRCNWCVNDPEMMDYHDTEWGVPLRNDRKLFEFLLLDSFQAGLSWLTILRKRENFRSAFDDFDPEKIAEYDQSKIDRLLVNKGIIRNRLKIRAAINNAGKYLEIRSEFGSFSDFIWSFVKGKTIHNSWKSMNEIPVNSPESDLMSSELKKRGFKFTGSTICYAFMQAAGMVNDHVVDCYRYQELRNRK